VLLVTGRELPDLMMRVSPRLNLFDRVVALCAKLIRLFFRPSLPLKLRKPSAPWVPVFLPAAGTDT
jgi:hypothetical protein